MDKSFLARTGIFRGMSEDEISAALTSLNASEKDFKKEEAVMLAGTTTDNAGLVLEGSVRIESNDFRGNRSILARIGGGQIFAETYALLEDEPMLVDVTANENSRILFLEIGKMGDAESDRDLWKNKVILNLLKISSYKTLALSGRGFHTAPKTIRGKVMAYLNSVALQQRSREFEIPFDRQQLADYLNVERSSLSKELGKMQREGIITFSRSRFSIHGDEGDF